MMRKLALFSLFALVACADSGRTETIASPIHNGTEDPSLIKHVLMLEGTGDGVCSSAVIHYPRCIISAAHCGAFTRADGGRVLAILGKSQPPEILEHHPAYVPKDFRHDLEIAWLKKLTTGQKERLQVEDYDPREPIVAGSAFEQLTLEAYKDILKEGASPFDATVAGYGESRKNGGVGFLRSGEVSVINYFGNALRSEAKKKSNNEICGGDSGGPLLFGGDIAGISSQTVRTLRLDEELEQQSGCNGKGFGLHTAFNAEQVQGDNGAANYDWTMDTVEEICTKWQTVIIDGEGSVNGSILPTQARPVGGLRGNDEIACNDDCQENFHGATKDRGAQFMTMTATPAEGWSFSHWSGESKIKKCQCDNQGASCFVAEGPMGYYDTEISSDEDVCIAHFVKENDGGDGGDGGDGDDGGD